jgi:hypothetical protein
MPSHISAQHRAWILAGNGLSVAWHSSLQTSHYCPPPVTLLRQFDPKFDGSSQREKIATWVASTSGWDHAENEAVRQRPSESESPRVIARRLIR